MGGAGEHAAQRIREQRAVHAQAEQARKRYIANGYTVTSELPEGAHYLRFLLHDGADLTPEAHATCPGHGIVVTDDDPEGHPYCAAPDANGHRDRYSAQHTGAQDTETSTDPETEPEGPSRQLVTKGNLVWTAAGKVRREFLKNLCGRGTVLQDAQRFTAKQILTMSAAVTAKLPSAPVREPVRRAHQWRHSGPPRRLQTQQATLIQLALVLTSYELLLTSEAGKACWRETHERRFPPVSRADTGLYFAALGYPLPRSSRPSSTASPIPANPP